MLLNNNSKKRFTLSALSMLLIISFPYASSRANETTILPGGDNPYTNVKADSNEVISGSNIIVEGNEGGSNNGSVSAINSGKITLSNSQVNNSWNGNQGARTINVIGNGSSVNLINTDVKLTATGGNKNHASAIVSATDNGSVFITGGKFEASGDHILGITSAGNYPPEGGGYIRVENAEIVTDGLRGHGVQAYGSNDSTKPLTQIDVIGGSVTTNYDGYAAALQSIRTGALVTTNNTNLRSKGNMVVDVYQGGAVDIRGGNIIGDGDNGVGIYINGEGSNAKVDGSNITMNGTNSTGVLATEGGKAQVSNAQITLTDKGNYGKGAHASNQGSTINLANTQINVKGTGTNGGDAPVGVAAENGGEIILNGGNITMEGDNRTIAARISSGGKITANDTKFITNGENSHAVMAWLTVNDTETGSIKLTDSQISTQGKNSYGITAMNLGSEITANDVDITTSGDVGRGVYAWNGGIITLNGGSITTSGELAAGLQASGASINNPEKQSTIHAANTKIATSGKNSDGIAAGWLDGNNGSINFTNGSISTSGENSIGAAARFNSDITLNNVIVQATGQNSSAAHAENGGVLTINGSDLLSIQSNGISLTNNSTVTLSNTTITANGASIYSTLNQAGQTQNITVGSGSRLTQNNGTLLEVSRNKQGMDGIINLTLAAGSISHGDISDLDGLSDDGSRDGGGKTNFILQEGASWVGIIKGINDIGIGNGGSFVNDGSAPITGNVHTNENASLVFNNETQIQGGLSLKDGSSANFNGNSSIMNDVSGHRAEINFRSDAILEKNVLGNNSTSLTFSGNTTIGQDVIGTGESQFIFGSNANIKGNVSGESSNFHFSKTGETHIAGNITIDKGAQVWGGSNEKPIVVEGDATVSNGAILAGNLMVNGTLSGTEGTLAPGNSVGTQTYASMANFSGKYIAEINAAGQSDKIIIQGNADLAGIDLAVAQENGSNGFMLNYDYTILETTNGGVVQNTFATTVLDANLSNSLVKLEPVQYGSENVKVRLSVDDTKLEDVRNNLTSNQHNTLNGILGAVGQNSAVDAAMLSSRTANAMDQLSGEIHSSLRSSLLVSSTMLTDVVSDRTRTNLKANRDKNSVWVQALGGKSSLDGNSNSGKSTNNNWGIAVGGAMAIGNGWQVGAAVAYNNEDIDVNSRSSSADVDTTSLLAYITNSWAAGVGNVNLLAGGGYSWHNIDTQRDVSLVNQTLKSSYDANTTQLFADLGYEIPVINSFTVEPYTGIGWYSQKTDDFTENGGSAALSGQGDTESVTSYNLGVRSKWGFSMGNIPASLNASAGWRHASGDIDSDSRMNLAQGSGSTFSVTGAPMAKDAAIVSVGLEAQLIPNAVVGISYNGQLASENTNNTGTLYMKYTF